MITVIAVSLMLLGFMALICVLAALIVSLIAAAEAHAMRIFCRRRP